ncbi:hypothetical protein DSUL_20011 [Desulfovibrionales bacterium]
MPLKNEQTDSVAENRDVLLEQELARLKQDYENLKVLQVRTEQNLENLERQLAELESLALAEYGTADPAVLESILEERRSENEQLVSEYRKHIQDIKAGLKALEDQATYETASAPSGVGQ